MNDAIELQEVQTIETLIGSTNSSNNNLTSCINTNNGKQFKCQPIYWNNEFKNQVHT